jgi:hypothetical protein
MKEKIAAGKCGGLWGESALSAHCIFVHTFSHLCTFSAMKLFGCQLCISCSLAATEVSELVVGITPKHYYGSDTKWIISFVLHQKKTLLVLRREVRRQFSSTIF